MTWFVFNPNALCRATGNVLPPYFYGWITDALCSTPSHFHPLLTELGNIYISKIMVDSEGLEPSFSTTNYDYTIYENASVRIQIIKDNTEQHIFARCSTNWATWQISLSISASMGLEPTTLRLFLFAVTVLQLSWISKNKCPLMVSNHRPTS